MTEADARRLEGANWTNPSVIVEDDVRIGANAVILAGVRLGKACVVAAGAVVSNNVPAGVMVVGNPARIVRPPTSATATPEPGASDGERR